jgi:hypothetical protein
MQLGYADHLSITPHYQYMHYVCSSPRGETAEAEAVAVTVVCFRHKVHFGCCVT